MRVGEKEENPQQKQDKQAIYDKKIHLLGIMFCRLFDKNATSLRECYYTLLFKKMQMVVRNCLFCKNDSYVMMNLR